MSEQDAKQSAISEMEGRPLVSFALFAYNQEQYIHEAIEGALAQDYSPLEIIISDDASTDSTYEKAKEIAEKYHGPHILKLRRNTHNLGLAAHINQVWQECKGQWIFAAAGDDISHPNRVTTVMRAAALRPDIKLFQCYLRVVDSQRNVLGINIHGDDSSTIFCGPLITWGFLKRIRNEVPHTHGASFAYSRKLIDLFGPLHPKAIYEDNVLNWRAELLNGMGLIREALVDYRNHEGQITSRWDGSSIAGVEHRRRRRLDSNVAIALQNMQDASLAFEYKFLTIAEMDLARAWASERISHFLALRDSLTLGWPKRVLKLARMVAARRKAAPPLHRDDFARSFLPDWLYFFLKGARNRTY